MVYLKNLKRLHPWDKIVNPLKPFLGTFLFCVYVVYIAGAVQWRIYDLQTWGKVKRRRREDRGAERAGVRCG